MRTNSQAPDEGNGPKLEGNMPPNTLKRGLSGISDMFAATPPVQNAPLRTASRLLRGNSGIGSPPKRTGQNDNAGAGNRLMGLSMNQPRM